MRKVWFLLLFMFPVLLFSAPQAKELTTVEATMIIDSLETRLNLSDNGVDPEIIYELAFLYANVDVSRAIDYSVKYLGINDKPMPVNNNYMIYGLLSDLYYNAGNAEKTTYYLNKQLELADDKLRESVDQLKSQELNTNESRGFEGITLFQIIFLGVVLILVIAIVVLRSRLSSLHKEINIENKKLEEANTKFNKFNSEVNKGVKLNTISQEAELEESKKSLIERRKSLKIAEESNYLKNAFFGNMSHQIRTPLSGILGFSDLLETELAVMGNEDLYDYAKSIQESGTKLMSLIANVIDISSIEANILELDIKDVDLNSLIGEIETEYLLKAKEKGLVFKSKFDDDIKQVQADKVNLLKVLRIITDNAVKYSSSGFVTVSTQLNDDGTAGIIIKDSGTGIAKDNLEQLITSFDFSRKGTSMTYTGQGLGLILANRLIILMNGTLNIKSEEGKGTEVKVTLPCDSEFTGVSPEKESVPVKPSIMNAPDLGVLKIFIVEDDRMNRMVIEKMLKKTGHVTLAVDGDDAIAKLNKSVKSKNIFDVILMDINLPAPWNGVDLMNYIRESIPEYKRVPFVAQTAYAFAGDEAQYLDAGFDEYVSKPLDKNILLTKIQNLLDVKRDSE